MHKDTVKPIDRNNSNFLGCFICNSDNPFIWVEITKDKVGHFNQIPHSLFQPLAEWLKQPYVWSLTFYHGCLTYKW